MEINYGDLNLKSLKKGESFQFERVGYFIVERAFNPDNLNERMIIFNIPDGIINYPYSNFLDNYLKFKIESSKKTVNVDNYLEEIKKITQDVSNELDELTNSKIFKYDSDRIALSIKKSFESHLKIDSKKLN
jgi:hypothetical protein